MSAFNIGQRVRIVRVVTPRFKHELGMEGRICETRTDRTGRIFYGLDVSPIVADGLGFLGWSADQLEPILYDGNQPVSWEECLWQPEGQSA